MHGPVWALSPERRTISSVRVLVLEYTYRAALQNGHPLRRDPPDIHPAKLQFRLEEICATTGVVEAGVGLASQDVSEGGAFAGVLKAYFVHRKRIA